jgi:2-amino-4-hydroxy-6-hydroxymethyldihydropteridine diphosphokinase
MSEFSILALGGNEPFAEYNSNDILSLALKSLSVRGIYTLKESSRYATPAFPEGSGPEFVNSVAIVDSSYKPSELLEILHEVEAEFGRKREKRWGPRTLDIDLIAVGEAVLPSHALYLKWHDLAPEMQAKTAPNELILPHPRIQDRAFVLVPLAEVMPDWKHPVLGLTAVEMLKRLPESDKNQVIRLPQP